MKCYKSISRRGKITTHYFDEGGYSTKYISEARAMRKEAEGWDNMSKEQQAAYKGKLDNAAGTALGAVGDVAEMGQAIAVAFKENSKINDEKVAQDKMESQAALNKGFSSTSVEQLISDSQNASNVNSQRSGKDYLNSSSSAHKNTAKGAAKAGIAGAKAGQKIGGAYGAAIGAVVGVLGGIAGGVFGRKKAKRKARKAAAQARENANIANKTQDAKLDAASKNVAMSQEDAAIANAAALGGTIGKRKKFIDKYLQMFPNERSIYE